MASHYIEIVEQRRPYTFGLTSIGIDHQTIIIATIHFH